MWGKPRTELVEPAVHGLQLIWSINWTDTVLQQEFEKGVATYLASISLPHILCGAPFSCITYLLPPNNPKHHIGINMNRKYLGSTISLEPSVWFYNPEPGSWWSSFSPRGTFQQWSHTVSSLLTSQTVCVPTAPSFRR